MELLDINEYLIRGTNRIVPQNDLRYVVRNAAITTYLIKDYKDVIIEGIFYDKELVRYNKKDDIYAFEKIIRRKKGIGNYNYLVK